MAIATMAGANAAGRLIAKLGLRALGVTGLLVAAACLATAGLWLNPVVAVVGVAIAAAGTGVLFVVAFGHRTGQRRTRRGWCRLRRGEHLPRVRASVGAAVMSSVAAISLTGGTTTGFTAAFVVAAVAAVVAAGITMIITPAPPSNLLPTTRCPRG